MIDIRLISVKEVLDSASLLEAHWEEIARNKELMELAPDHLRYAEAEELGFLFTLGVYWDTTLVGYSVNAIGPTMHYSKLTVCENDVIYLDPEYRNVHIGGLLIESTEKEAEARGARLMLWHAKENTPLASILHTRCDGVQDIIFSKRLA